MSCALLHIASRCPARPASNGCSPTDVVAAIAFSIAIALLAWVPVSTAGPSAIDSLPALFNREARPHLPWTDGPDPSHRTQDAAIRAGSPASVADILTRYDADWWGDSLPPEEAERLAANPLTVFVRRARRIDPAAAAALGRSTATLVFGAIDTLSPEVAAGLAGHRGGIRLDALTRIESESARLLATCHGWLELDGLQSLDAEAARELSRHRGLLSLNGLVRIDREVAESLAKHDGDLCLNGLASLAPPVADALACQRHALHLCGLQVIDDQIVTALTRFRGSMLSLDGLTTLETLGPEAADALRKIRGVSLLRVAR